MCTCDLLHVCCICQHYAQQPTAARRHGQRFFLVDWYVFTFRQRADSNMAWAVKRKEIKQTARRKMQEKEDTGKHYSNYTYIHTPMHQPTRQAHSVGKKGPTSCKHRTGSLPHVISQYPPRSLHSSSPERDNSATCDEATAKSRFSLFELCPGSIYTPWG